MTYDKLTELFDNLDGVYKHYCVEWDFLPIDETCPEFEACSCDFSENMAEDV